MAEIRGCDLVTEYLLKEKVPYLFGYAGHGAVGLLDGVYNHQDELKIIFPRIESAAGYMADAYFRASGKVIPVYTSTGPGPLLLTVALGNAFYEASAERAAFAEHVNVPVYTTFMGKGAISYRHPLSLGIAGCWGEYPATEAARNADVILAIGCRFSDIHCSSWVPGYTYNIPPTKLIHVDLDPQEIGRNYPTELGIVGDAREVLRQLVDLSGREPRRE